MTQNANQLAFTTAPKRREPRTFTLDGVEYHFTPPKLAGVVMPALDGDDAAAFKGMMDWLGEGLPDEEEKRLEARLLDVEDDLDVEDLVKIFQKLAAEVAGRPTPASSGS